MKRLMLFILLCFFAINLIAAAPLKANTDIDIKRSVRLDGAVTTTAICNITVYNPEWITIVDFKEMDQNNASRTYNYTLDKANTTEIGEYCYDMTCIDQGINTTRQYCFDVNVIGKEYSIAESVSVFLILGVVVFFFLFTLYGAIVLPFKNKKNALSEFIEINYKKHLKMFCIAMSYVLFVWIIFFAWNISYAFLQFPAAEVMFRYLFRLVVGLALPIFIGLFLVWIITYVNDKKIQKFVERNVNPVWQ